MAIIYILNSILIVIIRDAIKRHIHLLNIMIDFIKQFLLI